MSAGKKSTRRPRGEGTVYYDDKRRRWIGAVTVAGRRRKVVGKDKTEARARLAQLLAAKTTGAPVADRAFTVANSISTLLQRDVPSRRRHGRPLTPSTLELYRWAGAIIVDQIGTARLADLTTDDVEAMFDRLAKRQKLGEWSLRKIRSTLQQAITLSVKRHRAVRNVALEAKLPDIASPTKRRDALGTDDARRLLETLRGHRNGAMFALSLQVGLRPGEAAGLYWADLDSNVLNVRHAVRLVDGRAVVVDELKTNTSERLIELPAELADWLTEHRAEQVIERLAAPAWKDDRLIFASSTGTVLSPPNVRRQLTTICAEAGVPAVRPNELRHSCASLLSDAGVPNVQIADLLGHASTRMVDQTYRHRLRPLVDVAARTEWLLVQE